MHSTIEQLILDELKEVKRTCKETHDAVSTVATKAALAHQAATDAKADAAAALALARKLPTQSRALARDGGLTVSGASIGAAIVYVIQHLVK